jgi:peptide/nickel transport system permease protein
VGRYLLRRLAQAAIVVAGVILLTFAAAGLGRAPPATAYASPRATQAELEAVRKEFGLDKPAHEQLVEYAGGIVTGDWGTALHTHRPVLDDLSRVVPPTLELVLTAMLIALVLGVPLGLLAARRGGIADAIVRLLATLSVSAPVFMLALLLQWLFFQKLGLLPVAGEYDPNLDFTSPLTVYTRMTVLDALIGGNWPIFTDSLAHLVLPALAVAAYPLGAIAMMTRASVLEQLGEDHVKMARSLGFAERTVLGRLALRPALNPVVSLVALMFAYAIVNTFLVEEIFNWPGLGSYAVNAIKALDVNAIMGVTLFVAVVYVLANLAVDLAQAWLDPRIKLR